MKLFKRLYALMLVGKKIIAYSLKKSPQEYFTATFDTIGAFEMNL